MKIIRICSIYLLDLLFPSFKKEEKEIWVCLELVEFSFFLVWKKKTTKSNYVSSEIFLQFSSHFSHIFFSFLFPFSLSFKPNTASLLFPRTNVGALSRRREIARSERERERELFIITHQSSGVNRRRPCQSTISILSISPKLLHILSSSAFRKP